MRLLFYILTLGFLMASCGTSEKGNDYFYNLDDEIKLVKGNTQKIHEIHKREEKKYKESKDKKFLISCKYLEVIINKERFEKIPLTYKVLNLNNDEYEYISIICNFNLASEFERSSPEWAITRVDKAIQVSEDSKKKFHLAQLYHLKGRILYNIKKYNDALLYFNKALLIYKGNKKTLFIASMHNNKALCYYGVKNMDEAISETLLAINVLEQKKNLNKEAADFLYFMKGNLGLYYLEQKKYKKAEVEYLDRWDYAMKNDLYEIGVNTCWILFMKIYPKNKEVDKEKIINYLISIEPYLETLQRKISLNEVKQKYYLEKKDFKNYELISNKLYNLNQEVNKEAKEKMKTSFQIADNSIIKDINSKYTYEKRKMLFITLSTSLLFIVLLIIGYYLFKEKKRKEILRNNENIIFRNEKIILEQNLTLKNEKLKNFHLLLDLKTKTEKTFLDNLRKIRKSKNINSEEVLKDLFFKVNNLIAIDNQNTDITSDSSIENQIFINKLSEKFPNLNKQELDLCVYFRLNLTAKEISSIKNYTVGSIRVYKTKIKKKLGLGPENNLNTFLENFD